MRRRVDEQVVDLLRGEHGRRLVQDDQAGAAVQRLDDLHALLLSDRELPDVGLRVHLQPVRLGQLRDAGGDLLEVQQRLARRTQPQRHILRHGQGRHEHEMLVDHADAGLDGIGRRMERHAACRR